METSCWLDEVVERSTHHWGTNNHLRFVLGLRVIHVSPDPQRTFIIRTHVIPSNKFLSKAVIIGLCFSTKVRVGPLNTLVIYISTSVTNLVHQVEISSCVTCVVLNLLTWRYFSFHFTCSDSIITSVHLIKLTINVFRYSDSFHYTILACCCAIWINFSKMNGIHRLDFMEIIIILNSHICSR